MLAIQCAENLNLLLQTEKYKAKEYFHQNILMRTVRLAPIGPAMGLGAHALWLGCLLGL